jgi:hypothetical protein
MTHPLLPGLRKAAEIVRSRTNGWQNRINNLGGVPCAALLRDEYAGLEQRLLSEAEALEQGPASDDGWMPIESAPKDGTEILTTGLDSNSVIATKWLSPGPYVRGEHSHYHKEDGWYWAGWDGAVGPVRPTKWRPLPPAPKE